MKQLTLVFAFDGFHETQEFMLYLQELVEQFQVQIIEFIPASSSGAWPELTFRGTEENLIKLAICYHGDHIEDGTEYAEDHMIDDSPILFDIEKDPRWLTAGKRTFISDDGKLLDN